MNFDSFGPCIIEVFGKRGLIVSTIEYHSLLLS